MLCSFWVNSNENLLGLDNVWFRLKGKSIISHDFTIWNYGFLWCTYLKTCFFLPNKKLNGSKNHCFRHSNFNFPHFNQGLWNRLFERPYFNQRHKKPTDTQIAKILETHVAKSRMCVKNESRIVCIWDAYCCWPICCQIFF